MTPWLASAATAATTASTDLAVNRSWLGSGSPTEWAIFTAVFGAMLVIDLILASRHKDGEVVSARSAFAQTGIWVGVALAFGVWVYFEHGQTAALTFYTGYVIEEALSVDNLFVFLVIFSYFKVKPNHQRRVLFWGIATAVVLRAVLIFVGAAIIHRFEWVLYLFGVFLLYTAYKLLTSGDEEVEPEKNPMLNLMKRFVPITQQLDGAHFFTRVNGKLMATPLFAVLVVVETTDVVFALDSVPAIFAITTDTYLIYTSNIFAILGLRALYFALASMMGKFRYLNVGLALVLAFVGLKMLLEKWIHVPIPVSLGVVASLIVGSVVASLVNPEPETDPKPPQINPLPTHYGDTEPVKQVETKRERPAES